MAENQSSNHGRNMSPYIRSVFKSAFSQKAISGNFLGRDQQKSQLEQSSFEDVEDQISKEVLMLTQEELVVYPGPSLSLTTLSTTKLERFPLSQILSNNHVLFMEKISVPRIGKPVATDKDFVVVMTSDLIMHTFELSLKSSINSNVSPQQIKLISSHDTRNVIAASEVPKLKRVIQSSIMQHQDRQIIFILFDNLSFIIAKVIDAS